MPTNIRLLCVEDNKRPLHGSMKVFELKVFETVSSTHEFKLILL